MEKVKDLVCGMMVDPQTAAATSEYKGETYHFCAKGCRTLGSFCGSGESSRRLATFVMEISAVIG